MGATPSKISASRGAAVLGLSKWATPLDTWLKLMPETHGEAWLTERGYEPIVREDKAVFRWGHAFEDAICRLAEQSDNLGRKILNRELYCEHQEYDFVTCHQDGDYCVKTLHEGKTVFERAYNDQWGEPGTDHVPEIYQVQCQQQMACTGADEVILSVLVFPKSVEDWEKMGYRIELYPKTGGSCIYMGEDYYSSFDWAQSLCNMGYFHQYTIPRNQTLIDAMLEGYSDFWHNHVLPGVPPKAEKYGDLKKLLTPPVGTVIASEEIERICAIDKALAKEIKEAEAKRKKYKTMIGQYMKDNLEGASIDDDSREKIVLRDRQGRKLRSFSKKGGLR
jgi:predicted phage-related endonuclease